MNIVMSGSGSGGHIYPCIALYNELKKDNNIIVIIFKEIDKKIYDLNKIKYQYVDDTLSTFKKIKLINKIYKENKIDITITFGGKNSIYIQLVSKNYKVESYIFEQNAILGKANKINSFFVKNIFTNFKINHKKEINIGNPNTFNIKPKQLKLFNNKKVTLLFTMGSLGSSSVSKVINNFITNNSDYNIIYVTGNNVKVKMQENDSLKIYNYYNPLTDLINIADIVITRAGASTLSEIIYFDKPMIIIPSPYVANNHQEKNALILNKYNACQVIHEKDLNETLLRSKIRNYSNNQSYYNEVKDNIKKLQSNTNFNDLRKMLNL